MAVSFLFKQKRLTIALALFSPFLFCAKTYAQINQIDAPQAAGTFSSNEKTLDINLTHEYSSQMVERSSIDYQSVSSTSLLMNLKINPVISTDATFSWTKEWQGQELSYLDHSRLGLSFRSRSLSASIPSWFCTTRATGTVPTNRDQQQKTSLYTQLRLQQSLCQSFNIGSLTITPQVIARYGRNFQKFNTDSDGRVLLQEQIMLSPRLNLSWRDKVYLNTFLSQFWNHNTFGLWKQRSSLSIDASVMLTDALALGVNYTSDSDTFGPNQKDIDLRILSGRNSMIGVYLSYNFPTITK
jgi:hypothetical protein